MPRNSAQFCARLSTSAHLSDAPPPPAQVRDGNRARQPPRRRRVRRHDPRRLPPQQGREVGHHLGVPGVRRVHHGQGRRRDAARHRAQRVPRPRRLRRDVHREHDGVGDRGPRPLGAVLVLDPGVGPGGQRRRGRAPPREAGGVRPRDGGARHLHREGHPPARHSYDESVRECRAPGDGHWYDGTRLEHRNAARSQPALTTPFLPLQAARRTPPST